MSTWADLKVGDFVLVRFGSRGRQVAVIYRRTPIKTYAKKWRAKTKRWTEPVPIFEDELLRRASASEVPATRPSL